MGGEQLGVTVSQVGTPGMNALCDGLLRLGVVDAPLAATCRFSTMIRGVEWIPVRAHALPLNPKPGALMFPTLCNSRWLRREGSAGRRVAVVRQGAAVVGRLRLARHLLLRAMPPTLGGHVRRPAPHGDGSSGGAYSNEPRKKTPYNPGRRYYSTADTPNTQVDDAALHGALKTIGKLKNRPVTAVLMAFDGEAAAAWGALPWSVAEVQGDECVAKVLVDRLDGGLVSVVVHSTQPFAEGAADVYGAKSTAARVGGANNGAPDREVCLQPLPPPPRERERMREREGESCVAAAGGMAKATAGPARTTQRL
jgi:hypothetical protein